MSRSEFSITVEAHRADPTSQLDKDSFDVLSVELDGVDITKQTTPQQDAMLREALDKIFWSLPVQDWPD